MYKGQERIIGYIQSLESQSGIILTYDQIAEATGYARKTVMDTVNEAHRLYGIELKIARPPARKRAGLEVNPADEVKSRRLCSFRGCECLRVAGDHLCAEHRALFAARYRNNEG